MAHGVVGVAKAIARVDRASQTVIEERRRSCLECPFLRWQMCTRCGCAAFLKVLVAGETCPEGRWKTA